MMLIFWALTPLQSSIFGAQTVELTEQVTVAESHVLAPLDQQLVAMDALILQTAYGLTWLDRPFPAFTSSSYALLPFGTVDRPSSPVSNETLSSSATQLSTDIECWPAIISSTVGPTQFRFDNGRNCVADIGIFSSLADANATGFIVLYIGYHMEAHLDWYLESPNCTSDASHQFLAIWAPKTPAGVKKDDITALFCETSYKKQNVSITVSSTDGKPDDSSLLALDDPEDLTDAEFNATAFEYLIGTGVSPQPLVRDYPRDLIIDQFSTLNRSLAWPTTNMVGFAIGRTNHSLDELGNSLVLQEVFSSAHKTLFSAAVPQLLTEPEDLNKRAGTVQYALFGVVVSRAIAMAVEILLLVVCVLLGCTIWSVGRSTSKLTEDPGGRGATFTVLGDSDGLLNQFARKDCHNDNALEKSMSGECYELYRKNSDSGRTYTIIDVASARPTSPPNVRNDSDGWFAPVHPIPLRTATGLGFIGVLLAAIGILVFLKCRDRELGGMSLWNSLTINPMGCANDDRTTATDEQL